MKKLLLSAAIAFTSLSVFADFQGDGYYRVQNALTKRYIYLLDDKGSVDYGRGTADVSALRLFMDAERKISDPSTVFYIDCVSGENSKIMSCDISGQGTSLYSFFNVYMNVMSGNVVDGIQGYYAYATYSGMTKYLGDRRKLLNQDEGVADTEATGDYRLWYINPMDVSSDDEYFGLAPTHTYGSKYYQPFYAGFPFEPMSDGMKVYVVSRIDSYNHIAVLKEVKGVVPAATPVIIECSSSVTSGNRLNIGGSGSAVADNRMKGVYFNNDKPAAHINRTSYDKRTMRILTSNNGQLSFDVANIDYLPRNEAYLQLTNEAEYAVQSYRVMKEADYEDQYGAVEAIAVDAAVDVYTIEGNLVKAGITRSEVYTLGKGLYILRSGSAMEKLMVP